MVTVIVFEPYRPERVDDVVDTLLEKGFQVGLAFDGEAVAEWLHRLDRIDYFISELDPVSAFLKISDDTDGDSALKKLQTMEYVHIEEFYENLGERYLGGNVDSVADSPRVSIV